MSRFLVLLLTGLKAFDASSLPGSNCDWTWFNGHWQVDNENINSTMISVSGNRYEPAPGLDLEICAEDNTFVVKNAGCEGHGFLKLAKCYYGSQLLYWYTMMPSADYVPRSEVWQREGR
mmetsp:Transcript_65911/g.157456  ORF Transcript_65911/g.157456 Transcript_65911/m.157456 type:complete len:119 (+) Transcript_65911:38-394(+)